MRRNLLLIVLLLISNTILFGQKNNIIKRYKHYSVITKNDTVNYHTRTKKNIESINTLFLYIQGSRARSLYTLKERNGKPSVRTVIPFDFSVIPDNYLFAVISRKGFPFLTESKKPFPTPKSYFENQTLKYRANQADLVINDLYQKYDKQFDKIIVLGHSEGSDVVAKLGTINKKVTHFGYLAGGGNTQFVDFITFIRKDVDKGILTEEQAQLKIDSVFSDLKDIMSNPNATNKFWKGKDNSYKRWSHFSEPPVENLLQIDKPIFAAIGTRDQAVALESAYLIPIEFIRHQKDNLTFKVYPDLDHGFGKEIAKGKWNEHWDDVFQDFLNWAKKTE